MGIRVRGLFCFIACCEVSIVINAYRFGNNSRIHASNKALSTNGESTQVFNDLDKLDVQWEDGLFLNGSGTFRKNIVTHAGTDFNAGSLSLDTFGKHGDTTLPWIRTLERRHMKDPGVYLRHGRSTKTNQTQAENLESLPEPSAQNQGTDPPNGFSIESPTVTFPEEDYGGELTPLLPMNTRPKGPALPNPFFPLTGESYAAYVIVLVSVIIFTAGIIGNIAIMCTVCHNYYTRSVSNSLLANLALWDFLITFFCLPLVIFHQITKNWLLGEFSCKIIPYFEVASLGVTTFTICALCIDRFRAAANVQMYYETMENCASTAAKLAVIWLGALLLALPELLIHQLVNEDREVPAQEPPEVVRNEVLPSQRCIIRISTMLPDTLYVLGLTYDGARLWWHFGCYFCLPTVFTIISSVVTAQKIRQAERTSVRGQHEQIHLERRMNCIVVALAILYGFCVIPETVYNIVLAYMSIGMSLNTLDILHIVSQMLLFCKSAVTPVLLLILCQTFSKTFLHCCCCCLDECGSPKISNVTNGENENEATTELELSPYSTVNIEADNYTSMSARS